MIQLPKTIMTSYKEKKSFIHELNPLTKIFIVACAIFLVFSTPNIQFIFLVMFFSLPFALFAKSLKALLSAIKTLLPILVSLFLIQGLFYPGGKTILFELPFGIFIWKEGIEFSFILAARILTMITYFTIFIVSTHPGDLVASLCEIGIPYTVGFIILATIQIIPTVQARAERIIDAQKSRGLDTEASFIERIKAYVPLFGPLLIGSLVEASERAVSMEVRGFSMTKKKTHLRNVEMEMRDKFIVLFVGLISFISRVFLG